MSGPHKAVTSRVLVMRMKATEMHELRAQGLTFREIGAHFGHTPPTARAYVRWAEDGMERRALILSCADCGESFEPKRADAIYCSSACRQAAYRKRKAGA